MKINWPTLEWTETEPRVLAGVPKIKIQKLLTHYSSTTTDVSLDEVLAVEVATIAGKLRGRA